MCPSEDLSSRWSIYPRTCTTTSRRRYVYASVTWPLYQFITPLPGSPHTLYHFLSNHLPLLFPPRSDPPVSSRVNPQTQFTGDLAYALVQGVVSPSEAEIPWLGACLTGADGWLNICIGLNHL